MWNRGESGGRLSLRKNNVFTWASNSHPLHLPRLVSFSLEPYCKYNYTVMIILGGWRNTVFLSNHICYIRMRPCLLHMNAGLLFIFYLQLNNKAPRNQIFCMIAPERSWHFLVNKPRAYLQQLSACHSLHRSYESCSFTSNVGSIKKCSNIQAKTRPDHKQGGGGGGVHF